MRYILSTAKHSLNSFFTGSYEDSNISEFMGVIVIDGIQTVYCDRNSKTLEPRQDWMKKIFDKKAQMLEMFTQQCFLSLPSFFRTQISSLKQQFNQSGGAVLNVIL